MTLRKFQCDFASLMRKGAAPWTAPSRQAVKCGSVEGVSAGAGADRIGVVDGEALLLNGVLEVDGRAVEVGDAHLVHDHLDALEVDGGVPVEQALVEVELVDEAGAATGLDGDAQAEVVAT